MGRKLAPVLRRIQIKKSTGFIICPLVSYESGALPHVKSYPGVATQLSETSTFNTEQKLSKPQSLNRQEILSITVLCNINVLRLGG